MLVLLKLLGFGSEEAPDASTGLELGCPIGTGADALEMGEAPASAMCGGRGGVTGTCGCCVGAMTLGVTLPNIIPMLAAPSVTPAGNLKRTGVAGVPS